MSSALLIGPNGAGKTTLFNCVSRLYIPSQGDILFDGRRLLDVPCHRIAERGIGRTFQNLALSGTMTVLQNGVKTTCNCWPVDATPCVAYRNASNPAREDVARLLLELRA